MYEARRAADPSATAPAGVASFVIAPRRAARTRADVLRTRVAPTAVSVALLATSGAFALNLRAAEQATPAVPAPAREADPISRDTVRGLVETVDEAPAPEASGQGNEAFVGGQWAAAFGAPAGTKFAQANLTVRAQGSDQAAELGSVKKGDKVQALDKVEGRYRQVAVDGKVGYVLDAELGDKAPVTVAPKPAPVRTAAKISAPAAGKSVLGLKPRAMVVYNAVTARWSFSSIGGYRPSSLSNHQTGGAIDFMTFSDSAKGWAVAKFLAANAGELKVDHIIFEQKIWTPSNPYWRPMADRGSITANHYDHVHVSVVL